MNLLKLKEWLEEEKKILEDPFDIYKVGPELRRDRIMFSNGQLDFC